MQYQIVSPDPGWTGCTEFKENVFSSTVTRQGSTDSFESMDLLIDLKDRINPHAPVLCGASEMGGRITRHILNDSIPLICSLWVMFQTPDQKFLLFGTASWKIFTCDLIARTNELTVRFYGDRKPFQQNQTVPLEEIYCVQGNSRHEVLTQYADYVAGKHVKKLNLCNWRGWGNWDYYTSEFTEKDLLDNMAEIVKLCPDTNLLQIDDGYCVGGDWQEIDPQKLPRGLAPLVDDMKKQGIKTGIWLAPFMVNKRSRVAKEHPDWFLKNYDGSTYCFNGGEIQLFDYSKDEVVDYIRQCIRKFIRDGIEYFKLDFLACGTYPLLAANPMTPYERVHRCLNAIREEAGENTYLMGCSAVFGPCIGHVDGMRTGPDIGPSPIAVCMTAGCCMASYPFHRKWFQCDTDYLVLRGEGMSDQQVASCKRGALQENHAKVWADFLTLTGSTLLAADKISILSPERKEMLRSAWQNAGENAAFTVLDPASGGTEGFPSMIYSDGRLGIFNLSQEEKTFCIPGTDHRITLPPVSSQIIPDYHWDGNNVSDQDTVLLPLENTLDPFADGAAAEPISIDGSANAHLCSKRGSVEGIMDGIFAPLLGNMVLQNVPFSITDHVICIPYKADAGAEEKIMIPVNRKASKFYVLHSASYPTGGQWITYTIHFADGSVQDFPVNASENKLVADYHYAKPLQSASTRLAWTDPIRGRGVYIMQLDLTETREVTGFEIGNPSKMGLHMLLALSCM